MSTWYENSVFYHMYPLGMTGAPKQNTEDMTANRFEELNKWIPHIKNLNCSAIYIGPLFESCTHGYDTRDFKIIDRRLGTNEDFKAFVSLCHESNLQVIVDGVFNHTGRDFFAFKNLQEEGANSSYLGWYKGVNFGPHSPMGDPFTYESWRGIWELACLNLQNPDVKQYLFDVIRFWVNEFDIDGIRLDCANVLDFQFMKELRCLADTVKPDFWLMGEVIHGEYSRWLGHELLHSVTNYELHKSIYSAHNDHNYFELCHNIRRLETIGRSLYTFADNHDEDRIASKLSTREHLKPLYALLFTLPGIPSLYYGSEWGIEGHRSKTSDDVLRPVIAADSLKVRENELSRFISLLGKIHTEEAALHGGLYTELLITNRQYAFSRTNGKDILITAANNDDSAATISIPAAIQRGKAVDLLTDLVYPIEGNKINIILKGNDAVILKITEED